MKKVMLFLVLVAVVAPALADEFVDLGAPKSAGVISLCGTPDRYDLVYQNNTTAVSGYSRANPPAEEIGDDLMPTAGGILDHVAFTVYNSSSSAGVLATADLLVKFYNWDGAAYALSGSLDFQDVTLDLATGYYTWLTADDLAINNIVTTTDMLCTLTISDLTGGSNRAGQIIFNPITIGASDDVFYRDGSWYWFSGNPLANFGWELGVIPEPATLCLLVLGGALIRRR